MKPLFDAGIQRGKLREVDLTGKSDQLLF